MAQTAKMFVLLCLSVGALGGCATPDAQKFIDQYRLQPDIGALYEISRREQVVGWLYGSIHYGTAERPSMSPAAVQVLAQTRHLYIEYTDREGHSWPMRNVVWKNPEEVVREKREAATASVSKVWNGMMEIRERRKDAGGFVGLLMSDPLHREAVNLLHDYCGLFLEYGTERLAFAFAAGKDMTVHALETGTSWQSALDRTPGNEAKSGKPAAAAVPREIDEEKMKRELNERICPDGLARIRADQDQDPTTALSGSDTRIVESRNQTMAAAIAQATRMGRKPFMIVGRSHLVGEKNIVQLLQAQGFALRRID